MYKFHLMAKHFFLSRVRVVVILSSNNFCSNDKKINALRSINLKILSNYVLYKNYTTIKTLSTYVVLIVVVC